MSKKYKYYSYAAKPVRVINVIFLSNNRVRFENKGLGFCKQFNNTEIKEVIMFLINEYNQYDLAFKFKESL